MKKLFTIFIIIVLVVTMSMISFAGVLNTGYFKPCGYAGIVGNESYWYEVSSPVIHIAYVDQNTIIAVKSTDSEPDTLVLTCKDPVNNPDYYTCYYDDGVSEEYSILTLNGIPYYFTFLIHVPALGEVYYYTLKQFA